MPGPDATPQLVPGANQQQLGRVAREHRLQLRPDEGQQGQVVQAPHGLPLRRGNADFGFAQARAAGADGSGEHPAGRAVEQARDVVDAKAVLANARPRGLDTFPALGQLEAQARHQFGAVVLVQAGRGHQIVTTKQRPVRGHAGFIGAALEPLAQAHLIGQLALAWRRLPMAALIIALHLPLAIGLKIAVGAVLAQVEVQAAHCRPIGQGKAHLGLLALRQQAHVVIQIDFFRPGRRTGQQAQHQPPMAMHTHTETPCSPKRDTRQAWAAQPARKIR
ncbi:hypothetical protein D3C80_1082110 [compost metagenome]